MDIYVRFETLLNNFRSRLNGKKVFIWGYGAQGKLIEEYFTLCGGNIEAIIDDACASPKGIRTHYILNQYDPTTAFVIIAVSGKTAEDIRNQLNTMGFPNVVIRELFYETNEPTVDYFKWSESIADINFTKEEGEQSEIGNPYGIVYGIDIKKICSHFAFDKDDAIFDFGCGRGAALSMFAHCGIQTLGGVEYSKELYDSTVKNLCRLGIHAHIVHGDARNYDDLERYNYFYMYDPFRGDLFKNVIANIEKSYEKKPRKIILIYTSPIEHRTVLNHGMFKWINEISLASGTTRTANIYVIDTQ